MIEYQSISNELVVETTEITQNCGNIKEKISIDNYNSSCRYFLELKCPKGRAFVTGEINFANGGGEVIIPSIVSEYQGRVFAQLVVRDNVGVVVAKSFISEVPLYHVNKSINADRDISNEKVSDVVEYIFNAVAGLEGIEKTLQKKLKNGEFKGEKGDMGEQGIQGLQGTIGPQGDKGDKGDTGATGLQGPKGDKGETGAPGLQGPKGDKGDTGAIGPQGPKGDKGEQGIQGIQGIKGANGKDGTIIKINNIIQKTLNFNEDPQKQLNNKITKFELNSLSMCPSRNFILDVFFKGTWNQMYDNYIAPANGYIFVSFKTKDNVKVHNFLESFINVNGEASTLCAVSSQPIGYDDTYYMYIPICKGATARMFIVEYSMVVNFSSKFIYAEVK